MSDIPLFIIIIIIFPIIIWYFNGDLAAAHVKLWRRLSNNQLVLSQPFVSEENSTSGYQIILTYPLSFVTAALWRGGGQNVFF